MEKDISAQDTVQPLQSIAPVTRLGNNVDDIMFKDFLDTELTVKIYYREIDSYYDDPEIKSRRDDNELEDIIDFYILSGKEKNSYIHLSLVGVVDTDAAFFGKCTASYDWTDKDIREAFKRSLETSILEFKVKGS